MQQVTEAFAGFDGQRLPAFPTSGPAPSAGGGQLWRSLSLDRALQRVSHLSLLGGIITRKDLILMEEDEFGEMVQRTQPKLSPDTGWALRKSEQDAARPSSLDLGTCLRTS